MIEGRFGAPMRVRVVTGPGLRPVKVATTSAGEDVWEFAPAPSTDLEQQVAAEFRAGGKVAAVKLYRQLFGASLQTAVERVKLIVGEESWSQTAPAPTAPADARCGECGGPLTQTRSTVYCARCEEESTESAPTPPTPTGGAQPEADEATVEALARLMDDADAACVRSWSTDDTVYVTVPWEEKVERIRDRRRAAARAALAWSRARYGATEAALRGALERVVEAANGRMDGSFATFTAIARNVVDAGKAGSSALALTPSAAAEAVTKLAEAAANVWDALVASGLKVNITGPEQAAALAFLNDLYDATKTFLPARGGETDA